MRNTSTLNVTPIRPDRETLARQNLPYFVGVSGETVGARGLSMHHGGDTARRTLAASFTPGLRDGDLRTARTRRNALRPRLGPVISEAGDFLFIPPDTPHEAINLSATEPARAIVSRNDPAEQDRVLPYPPGAAAPGPPHKK